MHKLAVQGSTFVETCANMLQRMIEAAPKDAVLADVIKPQTIKPINATLDIDPLGMVSFTGVIRVSFLQSTI